MISIGLGPAAPLSGRGLRPRRPESESYPNLSNIPVRVIFSFDAVATCTFMICIVPIASTRGNVVVRRAVDHRSIWCLRNFRATEARLRWWLPKTRDHPSAMFLAATTGPREKLRCRRFAGLSMRSTRGRNRLKLIFRVSLRDVNALQSTYLRPIRTLKLAACARLYEQLYALARIIMRWRVRPSS